MALFRQSLKCQHYYDPVQTSAELLAGYVFRHRFLKPDIVILHVGGNDIAPLFHERYNPEYTHFRAQGNGNIPRPGEREILTSNVMKLVYARWLNWVPSVYQSEPKGFDQLDREEVLKRVKTTEPEGFRRNLDYLIKLIKGDGAQVILYGFLQAKKEKIARNRPELKGLEEAFVLGLRKNYGVMEDLANKYNVPFIRPPLDRFQDDWFQDNCHLNEKGEEVKAEILFEEFKNKSNLERFALIFQG